MILVTIGTNEQPFDRVVRAAAALDVDEQLIVQYGSSRAVAPREGWVEFLPFDELAALAREARVVVCHAGVGSIMMARRCGHRPIVVPRRYSLQEAVDDHQVGLSRQLARSGLVTLVEDVETLADAIRSSGSSATAGGVAGLPGADALAADLLSRIVPSAPKRLRRARVRSLRERTTRT